MKKEAFIYGIQPHSTYLEDAHRGVEKGRVSEYEYAFAQQRERGYFTKQQEVNGFTLVEDGKYNWQDIFRPIVDSSTGLECGELKRWFETNSFYRQPVINEKPRFNSNEFGSYIPFIGEQNQKVTLPSPFTFAKLSQHDSSQSFGQTLEAVTELISNVASYADSKSNVKAIQFNEPYAAYFGFSNGEEHLFEKALKEVSRKLKPETKLFVHFYFGDGAPLLKSLEEKDIRVDAYGVDFERTNFEDLPTNTSKNLIAGVVDSENSQVEDISELQKLTDGIRRHSNPSTLYITHNADMEFDSVEISEKKIKVLGELAKL